MAKKNQVGALLKAAQTNIAQAVKIVNGGQIPVAQDIAELMQAWGQINAVVSHAKAFTTAQTAMRNSILGAAC